MASTRGEMAGWWYQADVAAFSSSDAFARDTRAISLNSIWQRKSQNRSTTAVINGARRFSTNMFSLCIHLGTLILLEEIVVSECMMKPYLEFQAVRLPAVLTQLWTHASSQGISLLHGI